MPSLLSKLHVHQLCHFRYTISYPSVAFHNSAFHFGCQTRTNSTSIFAFVDQFIKKLPFFLEPFNFNLFYCTFALKGLVDSSSTNRCHIYSFVLRFSFILKKFIKSSYELIIIDRNHFSTPSQLARQTENHVAHN